MPVYEFIYIILTPHDTIMFKSAKKLETKKTHIQIRSQFNSNFLGSPVFYGWQILAWFRIENFIKILRF